MTALSIATLTPATPSLLAVAVPIVFIMLFVLGIALLAR